MSQIKHYNDKPQIRVKFGAYLNNRSNVEYSVDLGELGVWLYCSGITSNFPVFMRTDQVEFLKVGDFKV